MGLPAQSKLYFAAAALFLLTVALGVASAGFELRAVFGVAMAGALVRLGLRVGAGR